MVETVASEACVAYFTIDGARRVLEWPLAAAETLGVPAQAALGRPCYEVVAPAQDGSRHRCVGSCPATEDEQARRRLPGKLLSIRRRDGTREDLVCQPLRLPGKTATFLVLLSKPAVAGEKLDSPDGRLNVLRELVTALKLTERLADGAGANAWQGLLAALRRAVGADRAELFLRQPLTGELVLAAFDGEAGAALAALPRFSPGEDYPGLTAASEGPFLSASVADAPRWTREAVRARGFHAYAGMPLAVRGEVVGTVGLAWKDAGAPLPMAGRLLSWVAPSLAVAAAAELGRLPNPSPAGGLCLAPEPRPRHVERIRYVSDPDGHPIPAPGEVWLCGLGSFAVYRGGRPLHPRVLNQPKSLTLLKILLLAAGRPVARDRLVELLWPDSEPQVGANRLYVLAHRLRALLARDLPELADGLSSARGGYSLRLEGPIRFDLLEFQRRAREGWEALRAGRPREAVAAFEAAAGLYRGDLYDDDLDADWCQSAREEVREAYFSMLLALARTYRDLGMAASSIGCYRRLLARDPLREDAHRGLMESLWACGRRAEALEQYRRCATLIRRELGSEPSLETRQLYERLRRSLVG